MWSAASGVVSVPGARKPICKPDASEWDGTGGTGQTERAVLAPVRRGQRVRERSSETPETRVVVLITQRSEVQILPPLPIPQVKGLFRLRKGPSVCQMLTGS